MTLVLEDLVQLDGESREAVVQLGFGGQHGWTPDASGRRSFTNIDGLAPFAKQVLQNFV